MLKRSYLGEFEEIVLLTVVALGENAYGVAVVREIFEQTGRNVRLSQVHASLHRLESKGMVKSRLGAATAERGGRRKRLFVSTAHGRKVLQEIQLVRDRLWSLAQRTG